MSDQFIYSQKNNFSGGELTPSIEGRTELGLYQHGVKKLVNFMLLPSGGIIRRPGTKFMTYFGENFPKKIISVMFSRKLSYLLVFESKPSRTGCMFYIDGMFLGGKILKQDGADFNFKLKNFSYVVFQGAAYISFGDDKPIFKFSIDPEVLERFYEHINNAGGVNSSNNNANTNSNNNPSPSTNNPNPNNPANLNTESHNPTHAQRAAAREFFNRAELFIIEPLKCRVNYFKQGSSNISNGGGSNNNNPNNIRPFNEVIYNADIDRINDELKALHEEAEHNIYECAEEKIRCKSIAVFENRLWCFGANKNIHSIWASYKGDFSDFRMAYKSLLEARNPLTAFSATFSSSTFDNVLWSIPFAQELLLGTTDGIYVVKEGDRAKGEFIRIHKEIDLSVSPIKPVILGKTIFFVEGNNRKINSLFYSQEKGGFQIADITAYAEHIFASGIREITGINSPFSMIFATLADGSFASFTYSEGLKVMGWARHYLGGGGSGSSAQILSILPVYTKGSDLLYFYVRRYDDSGANYREYLEILDTKYFSAKSFSTNKPSYVDCHKNISGNALSAEGEIVKDIEDCIDEDNNNGNAEIKDGAHKLEDIIKSQAIMPSLNLTNIDIPQSFKYRGKLLASYPAPEIEAASSFLKTYYQDYLPVILETLGASFVYLRLMGRIYANLENIFSGDTSLLQNIQSSLDEARRLGNNITDNLRKIRDWNQNTINRDISYKFIDVIEYINNESYSFDITIIKQLGLLDYRVISDIAYVAEDIIKAAKIVVNKQTALTLEINEMKESVILLNKKILSYYAKKDKEHKQGLLSNLQTFFANSVDSTNLTVTSSLGFYEELKEISHPIVTKYLFSKQSQQLTKQAIATSTNTNNDIKTRLTRLIQHHLGESKNILEQNKLKEVTSHKRAIELLDIIRNVATKNEINPHASNFIFSEELATLISVVFAEYAAQEEAQAQAQRQAQAQNASSTNSRNGGNAESNIGNSSANNPGDNQNNQGNENDAANANNNRGGDNGAQSENTNARSNANSSSNSNTSSSANQGEARYRDPRSNIPLPPPPSSAEETYALMTGLSSAISRFREYIIDCANLLMPKTHRVLLKNILEDENSLKLEKHLMHLPRYFSLFKKIFPNLTNYDLATIVKNTKSTFQLVTIQGITNAYKNMHVAIIGNDKLQEIRILDQDRFMIKEPVQHLSIGFPYTSIMKTFPLIFPDEVEHMPKMDTEIGIKLYNTKGGYIEEQTDNGQIERQHINSPHIDSDNIIRFTDERKYLATKEVAGVLATPYTSGWIHFTTRSRIGTDIDCTYVVDKPVPAGVLKIYAKAKVLAGYRGL